jgi:hypothetical protein
VKKIKKPRKIYHTETKNLTKFFGSRLEVYLKSKLDEADLAILKAGKCQSIKGLKQLWLQSIGIREASRQFFNSTLPILEIMQSTRISDPGCAMKYISSYLIGIDNPQRF